MSSVSRKPSVMSSAVGAPRRSMTALVTSVVPWTTVPRWSGGTSPAWSSPSSAARTPAAGEPAVVSTLLTRNRPLSRSTSSRSVNVPPISTPARHWLLAMHPPEGLVLLDLRVAIQTEDVHLRGALLRQQPTVHHQRVPRDIARVVRGEKRHGRRDLLRRAHTPQRHRVSALALFLPGQWHRQDRARRHGVHADPIRGEVQRRRASERLDPALGRVIGHVATVRLRGPATRHADDAAALAARHQ